MKNFDWSSFTRRIAIKAPVSSIYNAWTKSSEIEKWFLSKAQYFNEANELINLDNNIVKEIDDNKKFMSIIKTSLKRNYNNINHITGNLINEVFDYTYFFYQNNLELNLDNIKRYFIDSFYICV